MVCIATVDAVALLIAGAPFGSVHIYLWRSTYTYTAREISIHDGTVRIQRERRTAPSAGHHARNAGRGHTRQTPTPPLPVLAQATPSDAALVRALAALSRPTMRERLTEIRAALNHLTPAVLALVISRTRTREAYA
jgi:hypothetical protein